MKPWKRQAAEAAVVEPAGLEHADQLLAKHGDFPFISNDPLNYIAVLDLEGDQVYVTHSTDFEAVLPLSAPASLEVIDPEDRKKLRQIIFETVKTAVGQRMEYRVLMNGGEVRFVESRTSVLWNEHKKLSKVAVVSRDITERTRAEKQLRSLSRAVEQSPAVIIITDIHGNIEYVNPKFCELTGYTSDEVIGRNPRILKSGEMPPEEYKRLWQTISSGGEWRGEFHNRKKNGDLYWEFASVSAIRDAAGTITHFLAVKEDVTDRKRTDEERIKLVSELQRALAKVKTLSGLLPICAWCKRVRDDEGYWKQIESYVEAHSDAEFTHGICPECAEKHRQAVKAGREQE